MTRLHFRPFTPLDVAAEKAKRSHRQITTDEDRELQRIVTEQLRKELGRA